MAAQRSSERAIPCFIFQWTLNSDNTLSPQYGTNMVLGWGHLPALHGAFLQREANRVILVNRGSRGVITFRLKCFIGPPLYLVTSSSGTARSPLFTCVWTVPAPGSNGAHVPT